MVAKEWAAASKGNNLLVVWQNKICHLCHFLRGWAKNHSGFYKKEKERLLLLIDRLDLRAEIAPLTDLERKELREANEVLANLRRDEEIKWAQIAKVKHIQEGGNNRKYFHLIANSKHHRKKIFQLDQDEGTIIGQESIKNYITNFYKKLFGPLVLSSFKMDESAIHDIP
jgi:hypothetical protein